LNAVIDVKNSGQTPAYNFVAVSRIDAIGAGKKYIPRPFEDVKLSRGILGPAGTFNPFCELEIPAENDSAIPGLKDGSGVVYVVGQVWYDDAFGRSWTLDFRFESDAFDENAAYG
jgi:hypothetical protein